MKMKEDFHKTNISMKCNDNNTFDAVKTWPECISSTYHRNKYISDNWNQIFKLSLSIKINEILMSSLFSCDLRKTCSNASYRRKSSSYAAGYHLWGLLSWLQEQKTTLMSKSEDIQKRFDLGYWKKWKSCSHLLAWTKYN